MRLNIPITALVLLLVTALPTRAVWELASTGDCVGKPFAGTPGELPWEDMCTPAFAGKTALCFTQVCNPYCNYLDVLTPNCQDGSEDAHIYTCRSERER